MAKDPAFLFYSADFYMGTVGMTDAQVGQYIRLMCLQHQQGRLTEALMRSVLGSKMDAVVLCKFVQDENGLYYNERLECETDKRNEYTKSRRQNARKKAQEEKHMGEHMEEHMEEHMVEHMVEHSGAQATEHMDEHMENENENENINRVTKGVARGKPSPAPRVKFSPPSLSDVQAYCQERGNAVDAECFIDHYASKGWVVGKTPMKDWRAAVRTWEKNGINKSAPAGKQVSAQRYKQREYNEDELSGDVRELMEQARVREVGA